MATHFSRWKFKHPRPDDFFQEASEVAGQDLTWYFDQVYRSSNVFDYGVQTLKSVPAGPRFRTSVVVRRYGEAMFPVDVLVTFADGEKVTERWDGRDRWKLFTYDRSAKAATAQVDPNRVLLLDVNYTNNSRTLTPKGRRSRHQMVDEVDGLAAGCPAFLRVLRMTTTPFAACRHGIGRVLRAPAILAGVWVLTLLVSLPLALGLRSMLEQHLGSSLAADTAVSGVNYDWWQEFSDQATGIGVTFKPTIIGFGAVLDNLSAFVDNEHRPVVIVGAAAAYVVLWIFLAGGIIDRYARERATRAAGFFAACGVFFFRFLRLAVVMGIVYGILFRYVHGWLFDTLYPRLVRDVTVERTAFFMRVGLYLVFGLLVGCVQPDLRLREGACRRRGSAQHGRRDSRRRAFRAAQRRRCDRRST